MAKGIKTGGRQKGSLNKVTTTVKESVLNAFNELQEDPEANVISWGKKNLKDFYLIASRLIPTEMAVKAEVTQIEISKTLITKPNLGE